MEAAKEAYIRGFSEEHPKVAWAYKGLGSVHEKEGNLDAALGAYEQVCLRDRPYVPDECRQCA